MNKIDAVAKLSALLGISNVEQLGLELAVSSPEAYLENFSERLYSRNITTVIKDLAVVAFADALEACDLNVMLDWKASVEDFQATIEMTKGAPKFDYGQFDEDDEVYDWIESLSSLSPRLGFKLGSIGLDGDSYELFFVRKDDAEAVFKYCDLCGFESGPF